MTRIFDWAEGDDLTAAVADATRSIRAQVSVLHAEVATWDLRPCPPRVLGR